MYSIRIRWYLAYLRWSLSELITSLSELILMACSPAIWCDERLLSIPKNHKKWLLPHHSCLRCLNRHSSTDDLSTKRWGSQGRFGDLLLKMHWEKLWSAWTFKLANWGKHVQIALISSLSLSDLAALKLDLLGESGSADRQLGASHLWGVQRTTWKSKETYLEPGLSRAMNPGSMRFTGKIAMFPRGIKTYLSSRNEPWRP